MTYIDREKYLASQHRYNEKHREERRLLAKKWRLNNKEKKRLYELNYRKTHAKIGGVDKYKLKHETYANVLYRQIKKRLRRGRLLNNSYATRNLHFSLDEFLDFLYNKSDYIILYKNWVENNFDKKLSPSVDRINNNVDYKIENIQIITVLDNLKKGSR